MERVQMPRFWLLKTEPDDYSYDDLLRDGVVRWDGVKAPQAQKNLALINKGDGAFIYHTGKERAVVGVARITSEPYTDPDIRTGKYLVVDVTAGEKLHRKVTLKEIKESNLFPQWDLVRLPRLSVVPVDETQHRFVLKWGRGEP